MKKLTTGEIIKKLRTEKGYSQQKLATMLNVAQNTVSQYENGIREPDNKILIKLSEIFDVTTDYLLGRTDIKNPPNETELPLEFTTPEEAMKFILEQNVIMGFGGFDVNKMNDEEVIEFANELLRQLKLLSYKYKK